MFDIVIKWNFAISEQLKMSVCGSSELETILYYHREFYF